MNTFNCKKDSTLFSSTTMNWFSYWFVAINHIIAVFLLIYYPKILNNAFKEDSYGENMGAFFLFFTSISLFISSLLFWRLFYVQIKSKKWIYILQFTCLILTSISFFFASGEEISWGQRVFNYEVSETWQALNQQQETNLHNLNTRLFNNLIETIILLIIFVPFILRCFQKNNLLGFPLPDIPLVLSFQLISNYVTFNYVKPQDIISYITLLCLFFICIYSKQFKLFFIVLFSIVLNVIVGVINYSYSDSFDSNVPREFREYLFSFCCFIYSLYIYNHIRLLK